MITDIEPNKFLPVLSPNRRTHVLDDETIHQHFLSDVRNRFSRARSVTDIIRQQQLAEAFELAKAKRLQQLNNLKTADDDVKEDTKETIEETKIEPSEIGKELIMMENSASLSDIKKKVYDIIINAFKEKEMSSSAIYCALQNIPYIDIIEGVIVVYTKCMEMFDKLEIPCINIALAIRNEFKGKNIKIKFIPCQIQTIADYFIKKK